MTRSINESIQELEKAREAIKTSLNEKLSDGSGGVQEPLKISQVAGYIDQIKAGSEVEWDNIENVTLTSYKYVGTGQDGADEKGYKLVTEPLTRIDALFAIQPETYRNYEKKIEFTVKDSVIYPIIMNCGGVDDIQNYVSPALRGSYLNSGEKYTITIPPEETQLIFYVLDNENDDSKMDLFIVSSETQQNTRQYKPSLIESIEFYNSSTEEWVKTKKHDINAGYYKLSGFLPSTDSTGKSIKLNLNKIAFNYYDNFSYIGFLKSDGTFKKFTRDSNTLTWYCNEDNLINSKDTGMFVATNTEYNQTFAQSVFFKANS